MNGNHFLRHRVVHVPARDVVAHQRVQRLDRGLHAVRARLHAVGDVEHRHRRSGSPAISRYITALLKSNGPGSSIQVSSLNSFCGCELLVVAPGGAEDERSRRPSRRCRRRRCRAGSSCGCSWARGLPFQRAQQQRGDEVQGEGGEQQDGGREPVLPLAGQSDGQDGKAHEPRARDQRAEVEADRAADVLLARRDALDERRRSRGWRSTRRRRRRSRAPAGPSAPRTARRARRGSRPASGTGPAGQPWRPGARRG